MTPVRFLERPTQSDLEVTVRVLKPFAYRGRTFGKGDVVSGDDPVIREVLGLRPELLSVSGRRRHA